ncbi:hypothetical protein BDK92_0323 [Micromonospora pisi]|uniref:Uncharacterized protein n=1 Tax=Micromonospora pisi TaxID=589240 RepID=A0A495JCL6_9ACTN|nr:hypothetical protein [Micromonospora pisi]RKR86102.1 hypothetical protein BDK92_0323 [Micromonospora pisi]
MGDVLRQALEPVLRDINATGAPLPDIRDDDWTRDPGAESAMLWSPDGSGVGVSAIVAQPAPDRVAHVADQVQEWVIEELWRRAATNWPVCPRHPDNHPLTATVRGAVAVWVCPVDGAVVAPVGALA